MKMQRIVLPTLQMLTWNEMLDRTTLATMNVEMLMINVNMENDGMDITGE